MIEDDEDYAMLIKTFLDSVSSVDYKLIVYERLSSGLDFLTQTTKVRSGLLDLSLP